jgi:hypothetical protein
VATTWHYVERPRLKQTARTTEGRDPRPGGQGQQEANASVVFTPYKGNDKPESQKQANRAHAKLRSLGEHANAQLTSRILRKLRRPEQGRPPGERTVSWLSGCRRLHRRYERKPEHFLAFVGIAATLICHRRLAK